MEILKAVIFGFVHGVTEWLPVSSTGHMILLNEFLPLYQSKEFLELFFVVIQFGSILAVPVMLGASLFKMVQFGLELTWVEAVILLTGMIPAFLVSLLVIQGLMNYIKGHSFKSFGWYRIGLGIVMAV